MAHPHAPQGLALGQNQRPVGFGGGGLSGLVGPGSSLSATPAVPAAPPVAPPALGSGSLGSVLGNVVQRSTAALPIAPPPVTALPQPAAPALDPITSARGRQFSDNQNPRSLF